MWTHVQVETPLKRRFVTLGRCHPAASSVVALSLPLAVRPISYTVKTVDKTPAPKEVQEPIRKLLAERCVQLLDAKGDLLAEVWFRKDVPAKATDAQIKNGLTYREIPETTLFGAIRFPKRSPTIASKRSRPACTRCGWPISRWTATTWAPLPYSEFLLLSPAAEDKKPDTMEPKALQELSGKTTSGHPGVMLLFPARGGGRAETGKKGREPLGAAVHARSEDRRQESDSADRLDAYRRVFLGLIVLSNNGSPSRLFGDSPMHTATVPARLAVVILLFAGGVPAWGGDWPQWRGPTGDSVVRKWDCRSGGPKRKTSHPDVSPPRPRRQHAGRVGRCGVRDHSGGRGSAGTQDRPNNRPCRLRSAQGRLGCGTIATPAGGPRSGQKFHKLQTWLAPRR